MSIVVVGAGVTGLTIAERLCDAGKDVLVLDKEPLVGGLCRSYHYGDFTFDVGPHRLFSAERSIEDYFFSVLDSGHTLTPRHSMVYMNGRYLAWPLSFGAVFRLPPGDMIRCMRDLVFTNHRGENPIENLEDDIVARYGKTIYEMFWKGYTEKFLRLPCNRVDAAWGNISVKRSVVDGRTQPLNLGSLCRSCLLPRQPNLTFIYPDGGMDAFPACYQRKIEARGGRIRLSQSIEHVTLRDRTVTEVRANGVAYPVDQLIWTGMLPDLLTLLQRPRPALRYLSTVLYNLEIDRTFPGKWQWIYYPDPGNIFSRISLPARFSPTTVPPGKSGLCVEVACTEEDEAWRHPEALTQRVIDDLLAVRLIASRARILDCHVERVPNTYPIYETGFQRKADAARHALNRYTNLHVVGRQATFVHDNIDESVENALHLAARLEKM